MYWQRSRALESIPEGAITQGHVDAARRRWEEAHETERKLSDPTAPGYRQWSPNAPIFQRELAEAERLARLARTEYQMLADRFEAQERRARMAREELLLQRQVEAAEEAARRAQQMALAPSTGAADSRGPATEDDPQLRLRQETRLRMLHFIYDQTKASEQIPLDLADIANHLGVFPDVARNALDYLRGEHLVRLHGTRRVTLLHAGIVEAEAAKQRRATRHFPLRIVQNVINNFLAPVAAVQNGSDATANVQQTASTEE